MARHNRAGEGQDQLGRDYVVSYQPDWLYQIKVTRDLESGRQSTKTLFRNPAAPEERVGPKVRTRIQAKKLGLDVEVVVADGGGSVVKLGFEAVAQRGPEKGQRIGFTISPHVNSSRRRAK